MLAAGRSAAQNLHVGGAGLEVFELAAAVDFVTVVHRIIRPHPLNDKTILNYLVHIRLFTMHALLNFVVRLLNKP